MACRVVARRTGSQVELHLRGCFFENNEKPFPAVYARTKMTLSPSYDLPNRPMEMIYTSVLEMRDEREQERNPGVCSWEDHNNLQLSHSHR